MEESTEVYKFFESKPILIVTNSGFRYHSSDMMVLAGKNAIFFTDNRNQKILIAFSEIKFIQEEKE